ncbi:MAG: DUF3987 domain-containing protein, partial [Candidatus Obscuribacterales bacterium]|nr:DUF3987 domain-containing protein [Candidatus Obscuribacterales bacterium]
EFSRAVSYTTQTPEGMVAVMIIAACAVCVQKKFRVTRSRELSDWIEPVNIWVVCAAEPGARKTEVFKHAYTPIKEWSELETIRTKKQRTRHNTKQQILLNKLQEIKKRKSDDPSEVEQWADEAAQLESTIEELIPEPMLVDDESTVEGLEKRLEQYGGRWSFFSDEGGVFEIISGLYSGGKVNLNTLLKAHTGQDISIMRASREAKIKSPALTVGLMVQPGVLESLGESKKLRTTGGLARFLYACPESNIGERDNTLVAKVMPELKKEYQRIIWNMLNVPLEADSRLLAIEPAGLQCFLDFSQGVENLLKDGAPLHHVRDWGSKLAGAGLRIAAIFHLIEQAAKDRIGRENDYCDLEIKEETLREALEFCSVLISHAVYAFWSMCGEQAVSDASAIIKRMLKSPTPVPESDLKHMERFRQRRLSGDQNRFKIAIEELQSRNIVRQVKINSKGPGRPALPHYELNPAVRRKGALHELVG